MRHRHNCQNNYYAGNCQMSMLSRLMMTKREINLSKTQVNIYLNSKYYSHAPK